MKLGCAGMGAAGQRLTNNPVFLPPVAADAIAGRINGVATQQIYGKSAA